jgi:hypothetical protein
MVESPTLPTALLAWDASVRRVFSYYLHREGVGYSKRVVACGPEGLDEYDEAVLGGEVPILRVKISAEGPSCAMLTRGWLLHVFELHVIE